MALIFATKIPEILKTRGRKAENVTKLEQVSCSQVSFPRRIDERRYEFELLANRVTNLINIRACTIEN